MTKNPAPPCPECGTPIPPNTGTGRPKTYCSSTCRRLREFAVSRAQRALERAQTEATNARRDAAAGGSFSGALTARKREQFWTDETTRCREHLRDLLAE